jgi:hypothetical protein
MKTNPTCSAAALALFCTALLPPVLAAQVRVMERANWSGVQSIASGGYHDATRNLLILSSLGELKEWDGPGTARSLPFPGPVQAAVCEYPVQPGAGLVWNEAIGTWKYAAGQWTQLLPAGQPVASGTYMTSQRLVFDTLRNRAVLLIGTAGSSPFSCWQFDGSAWSAMPLPPGNIPLGGMAWDEGRAAILCLTDAGCWLWNGAAWVQAPNIPGPFYADRALAYDRARQRLVAFGGYDWPFGFSISDAVWEWTGAQWAQVPRSGSWPSPRSGSTMVYDRLRQFCIVFGGDTQPGVTSDEVWAFDGTGFTNWSASTVRPPARNDAMLGEDEAHGSILFGGRDAASVPFGDTWLWNGDAWTQLITVQSPSARSAGALARSGPASVLLFGGMDGNGQPLGDTWSLTAAAVWTQRTTAQAPAARLNHAMACELTGGNRVWLFGGTNGNLWFDDLWVYDPNQAVPTWTPVPQFQRPPARDIHVMTFDDRRNRLVLFGGRDSLGQALDDTWEFDVGAGAWTLRTPARRPWPRHNAALTFDSLKGRAVLAGGYEPWVGNYLADLWEWDGTNWTESTPATAGLLGAENFAACYDRYTNRTVLFGGQTGFGPASDTTWELQEHVGRTALGQAHPIDLAVVGQPVVGTRQAPLRVDMPSASGVSALFVGIGLAPTPYALGPVPPFCSPQHLYVSGVASFLAFGNPGRVSLDLPPVAAGAVLSFQGVSLQGSCVDATDAWFVRVRSM